MKATVKVFGLLFTLAISALPVAHSAPMGSNAWRFVEHVGDIESGRVAGSLTREFKEVAQEIVIAEGRIGESKGMMVLMKPVLSKSVDGSDRHILRFTLLANAADADWTEASRRMANAFYDAIASVKRTSRNFVAFETHTATAFSKIPYHGQKHIGTSIYVSLDELTENQLKRLPGAVESMLRKDFNTTRHIVEENIVDTL